MCTIKRVGRWGGFSPSAFYLLNIINDQSLFLTEVFRKPSCLTAKLQYLKVLVRLTLKSLNWLVTRDCCGKGRAVVVQESSVLASLFPQSPLSPVRFLVVILVSLQSLYLPLPPARTSSLLSCASYSFGPQADDWSSLLWFSEGNQKPPGKKDFYFYKRF